MSQVTLEVNRVPCFCHISVHISRLVIDVTSNKYIYVQTTTNEESFQCLEIICNYIQQPFCKLIHKLIVSLDLQKRKVTGKNNDHLSHSPIV